MLYSRSLPAIHFIHSSVYMSIPTSQSIPTLLPRRCPYICSLHLSLYFCFAMDWFICTVFSRFHMYALMYDTCFLFLTYFSLYDSLSVHPPLCKLHNFVSVLKTFLKYLLCTCHCHNHLEIILRLSIALIDGRGHQEAETLKAVESAWRFASCAPRSPRLLRTLVFVCHTESCASSHGQLPRRSQMDAGDSRRHLGTLSLPGPLLF